MSALWYALIGLAATGHTQESVYPDGFNISCDYQLSDTLLSLTDTLTITRQVVNDESIVLTDLYFSEHLPSSFRIVEQSVTINGTSVPYVVEGPRSGEVLGGYRTYRWIVDFPEGSGGIQRQVSPGDRVQLWYRVVATVIGKFPLPMHTTVFYANNGGLFAVGSQDTVQFTIALDTGDGESGVLPSSYLLSNAYPNPFNADVTISFEGGNIANRTVRLEVFNVLGQELAAVEVRPLENYGTLHWSPPSSVGSGVFFYRLSCENNKNVGRLVLLK